MNSGLLSTRKVGGGWMLPEVYERRRPRLPHWPYVGLNSQVGPPFAIDKAQGP